ncbi:hypothetical protein [Clavibacter sp. CFBP 8614]|uniref:hypothetical protein n=1 Tax=unclassified Clavibacter TaxID=2626594 RepID=UPI0040434D77
MKMHQKILAAAMVTAAMIGPVSGAQAATRASTGTPPGLGDEKLSATTIALCNAGFGDVSVQSWDVTAGHLDMFCGDKDDDDMWVSGYNHIRDRHQGDWQAIVDSAGGGGNWDDLMMFMTDQSIRADDPEPEGDSKLCYSTSIEIHDEDGALLSVYNPTVIVSANTRKVITSYPTIVPDCAGVRD